MQLWYPGQKLRRGTFLQHFLTCAITCGLRRSCCV